MHSRKRIKTMGSPQRPSTTLNYFENALNSIQKTQDPDRLLKALLLMRKEIEGPKRKENVSKIHSQSCLKHLADALAHKNGKIVNTTLSILGYCCLNEKCAIELVQRYGILPHLHRVIKEFKHDSIQGRTFKLIGNLCLHQDRLSYHIVTKEPYIIKKIVSILKETNNETSDSTILVGIRALREMALKATVQKLIEFGALEAIGVILIKFVPIWEESKAHEDILKGVLAFLLVYSKYKCNNLIPSLRNTSKGNAILYLGRLALLSPYQVVAIMMNFDDVRTSLSDLPIKEVGQSLIDIIKRPTAIDESLFRNHLKCVCFLLHNPANKEALKSIGIMKVLIDVISLYKSPTSIGIRNCILVLMTLRIYLNDYVSVAEMLSGGIIKCCIEKLEWLLGPTKENEFEIKHKFKPCPILKTRKRRHSADRHPRLVSTYNTQRSDRVSQDGSQSPISDISYTSDISLTPPSSPLSYTGLTAGEQSDSDDYSPVCSDEEEETRNQIENSEIEISPYYDDKLNVETNDANTSSLFELKLEMGKQIIELAKLISYSERFTEELLQPKFVISLLYFFQFELATDLFDSIKKIIFNITMQPKCLIPLMETNFFFLMHSFIKKKPHLNCSTCKMLHDTAEHILFDVVKYARESGEGDIAYKLLRNDLNVNKKLVSCIPIIIHSKPLLKKLMSSCGALEVLLESFRDLDLRSIVGLCILAQKLNVSNPVTLPNRIHQVFFDPANYKLNENCSKTVTFLLDDGSEIKADRDFLSSRSPYFHSLLSGKFKEADEEEIRLCNVTQRAFQVLLQLMEMKFELCDTYNFHTEFNILLEVISLTDQYLIEDLSQFLITAIQCFKLDSNTVPVIYKWSVESGTDILRIEAVAYSLVADVRFNTRYQIYKQIAAYGFIESIVSDIKSMLVRFLNIHDSN